MANNNNNISITFTGNASSLTNALSQIGSSLNNLNGNMRNTGNQVLNFGRSLSGMGAMLARALPVAGIIIGLKSLTESFLRTRIEYEKLEAAISATVGLNKTEEAFQAIQKFAKETPYDVEQVTKSWLRLINLGLDPSEKALRAYGNAAAAQPGKELQDVAEAVADAMTGEFERLKEFGIKAKQLGKDGKKVQITFRGMTDEIDNNSKAIEQYLIKSFSSVANGKAMENQAKTLAGSYSALTDTFKQFQNNVMKSIKSSEFLSGFINKIADGIAYLNTLMTSGSLSKYFDSVVSAFQPFVNFFNSVKDIVVNKFLTPLSNAFTNIKNKIVELAMAFNFVKSLKEMFDNASALSFLDVVNKIVDSIAYLGDLANGMLQEGTFEQIWKWSLEWLSPLVDKVDEYANALRELINNVFPDLDSQFESVKNNIMQDAEEIYNSLLHFFNSDDDSINFNDLVKKIREVMSFLPGYIQLYLKNSLAHFFDFQAKAIAIIQGIKSAVTNLSTDNFYATMNLGFKTSEITLKNTLKANEEEFGRYKTKMEKENKDLAENFKKAQNAAAVDNLLTNIVTNYQRKQAKELLDNARKPKGDELGKLGREAQAGFGSGGSASSPTSSGKSSGKSANAKSSEEYKKMLDNMLAAEEDMYKRGEVSAKQHFNKVLELKLAQLDSEQKATSKNIEENNKNINSINTNEKDKQKLVNSNIQLQDKMNKMSEQEKGIRAEIARQLRDAEEQYKNTIFSLQKELDNAMGINSFSVAMQEFDDKYREISKRIQAEDKENGENNYAIFEKLRKVMEATARIKQSNSELDIKEAQSSALKAESEYKVAAGLMSQSEAFQTLLSDTEKLKKERVAYYENELKIALATEGYSQKEIANLKEKLYLAKTASLQLDQVREVQDKLAESFTSFFSDIASGTDSVGDAFKNLGKNIVNSINSVIAQNLSKQLMASLFGGVDSSGNGGTGALSSVGGWITKGLGSLLSSSFATGGIMRPNSLNLVGEHGPELIKTGATSDRVFNRAKTNSILNSQDGMRAGNVNVYVTAKDANSFNQSKSQIQQNVSRELSKSYNRNS